MFWDYVYPDTVCCDISIFFIYCAALYSNYTHTHTHIHNNVKTTVCMMHPNHYQKCSLIAQDSIGYNDVIHHFSTILPPITIGTFDESWHWCFSLFFIFNCIVFCAEWSNYSASCYYWYCFTYNQGRSCNWVVMVTVGVKFCLTVVVICVHCFSSFPVFLWVFQKADYITYLGILS